MGDKPSFTFKVGINKYHSQKPWEKILANMFTIQGKKKKLIDSNSVNVGWMFNIFSCYAYYWFSQKFGFK